MGQAALCQFPRPFDSRLPVFEFGFPQKPAWQTEGLKRKVLIFLVLPQMLSVCGRTTFGHQVPEGTLESVSSNRHG